MHPESIDSELSISIEIGFVVEGKGVEAVLLRHSLDIPGHASVMLSVHEQAFLAELTHPLGEPRLAVQLAKNNENLRKPVDISSIYTQVKSKLASTVLDGHLIRVGQGKSTWYGMLADDSDEARLDFAQDGIDSVNSVKKIELLQQRRRQPFMDLIDFVSNGEEDPKFTRNKKLISAGAATVAITIGSAATVYVIKHRKSGN
jgi:hypothetical protein